MAKAKKHQFKEGQRVRIKPDSELPESLRCGVDVEEFAEYLGTSGKASVVMVQVEKAYRQGKFDDGLRECSPRMIEPA